MATHPDYSFAKWFGVDIYDIELLAEQISDKFKEEYQDSISPFELRRLIVQVATSNSAGEKDVS